MAFIRGGDAKPPSHLPHLTWVKHLQGGGGVYIHLGEKIGKLFYWGAVLSLYREGRIHMNELVLML